MTNGSLIRYVGAILGGLLFAYVASVGPVVAYADSGRMSEAFEKNLHPIYLPLVGAAMLVPPFGKFLDEYIRICRPLFPPVPEARP